MRLRVFYIFILTASCIIEPMATLSRVLRLTGRALRKSSFAGARRGITTNEAYKVFGFNTADRLFITPEDTKALYRTLQLFWHVDRNPDFATFAHKKTQEINAAYKIILDDQKHTQNSNFDVSQKKQQLKKEYDDWKEYQQFKQKKEEELRRTQAHRQKQRRAAIIATSGIMGIGALTWGAIQLYEQYETDALHQAIEAGDDATIKKMCAAKTALNKKNKAGDTPLIAALKKHNPGIAIQLIQAGADILIPDSQDNSPLLWAAAKGFNDVVQLMLPSMSTAERITVDGEGNTALHQAVLFGHTDTALFIATQQDIDISTRNREGKTALQIAAESNNNVLFSQLLAIADRKNPGDKQASNQETSCVRSLWKSFATKEQIEKIDGKKYFEHRDRFKQLVLTNQIAINQVVSYGGATLLILAAFFEDYEIVSLLLKKKADPNLKNDKGNGAIHLAKNVAMAEMLKQAGADINQAGENGNTALHASSDNYALSQWLLQNGANVDALNHEGTSPIFYAKSVEMVQLFKKYNASLTLTDMWGQSLLHYAMKDKYDPKIIGELTNLAQKKLVDKDGYTPWHTLADNCRTTPEENLPTKVELYLPYGRSYLTQKNERFRTAASLANEGSATKCKTLTQVFIKLAQEKRTKQSEGC